MREDGPDGGWGWMVCLGTFIVACIVEGTTAAFGILIIPIQEEFSSSKSSTTWVASITFGMCLLVGPVVGLLLDKYSLRQVTICGSLIGFFGFSAAAFSPNVTVLMITYGFVGGIGMGITFLTAIVAVGKYFNRRRALATGIAMSGAGVGMFVYPYLTDLILQMFDWRGTVLLIGGAFLNCAVSGTIFRPISEQDYSKPKLSDPGANESLINSPGKTDATVAVLVPRKYDVKSNTEYTSLPEINKAAIDNCLKQKSTSLNCVKTLVVDKYFRYLLSQKDIYHSGFLQISCDQISTYQCVKNVSDNSEREHSCSSKLAETFIMLKDPLFILVLLPMLSWSVQYICTIYIADFAYSKGIERAESALLVSIIGISNTFGRIVTGFIVDCLHVKSITLYLVAFIVISTMTFLLPLCSTFWLIALYCTVAGFCVGTFVAMRTVLIVDVVGIGNLSYAFGWVSFFQGVVCIPVPPLAGFIYDVSHTYTNTFIMVACFYTCGVVSCLILRLIGNRGRKEVLLVKDDIG